MIEENGVVRGVLDAAEGLKPAGCWEAEGLVRSVSEAEERRSVTAEVAVVIVVLDDSI